MLPSSTERRRRHRPAPREHGFSLLEVLVAFVILSLVATALFRLFSGALNNASASEDYSRAVLVAESALDEAAAGTLKEGSNNGDADNGRIQWSVAIAPYDPPQPDGESSQMAVTLPFRLYRVTATSAFKSPNGGERRIVLTTLRLGARDTQ